jgi:RES domain-containing protein
MEVFRISSAKWAGSLTGSGQAARWNSYGVFVCYAASTRALACLEMLVHLAGEQLKSSFKLTDINIPDTILIENAPTIANTDWHEYENYYLSQEIGDEWAQSLRTCVLRVPSAIIAGEYNYLINPRHADFSKITIAKTEDFYFDMRLKG